MEAAVPKARTFSRYQVFLIAALAFVQFTVVLDFMVMSPLGPMMIPALHLSTGQFSHVVMGYAIAAGISGLLAAGFADRYDRKKLLLFFYVGFIIGTLFCGLAPTYGTLLAARVLTGVFGGVLGSISLAIVTDSFLPQVRGRVMGFVQLSLALSQVAGIPIGVALATRYDWHAPFLLIVGLGTVAGLVIFRFMRPVADHLDLHGDTHPVEHLWRTFTNKRHTLPFLTMMVLATGGFMMMPFSATFIVNNVGIPTTKLPMIYVIIGACSMVFFPLVGKASDRFGKVPTFAFGTVVAMTLTVIYSHLSITPLYLLIIINAVMFIGIASRMVSSSALMTLVPEPGDRGAFMSINSSIQMFCGGLAAGLAGLIVQQDSDTSPLRHFDTLGFVCCGTMLICVVLVHLVNKQVDHSLQAAKTVGREGS